jgi:hypothetical protein
LLTIDEAKVRESLATSKKPSYVVTVSHLVAVEPPPVPTPSSSIGGTMMVAMPRVAAGTREYVMSLRRKIEESGERLKTADELEKEIDEMKGRSR